MAHIRADEITSILRQEIENYERALDVTETGSVKLVARLLTETPFKSVLGQEWVRDGQDEGHAPTTRASFQIVPRDYGGSFLAVSSKKCMTCHETTSMHADDFQFARDWYGRVR